MESAPPVTNGDKTGESVIDTVKDNSLAFSISEVPTKNYTYIIHLPMDVEVKQEEINHSDFEVEQKIDPDSLNVSPTMPNGNYQEQQEELIQPFTAQYMQDAENGEGHYVEVEQKCVVDNVNDLQNLEEMEVCTSTTDQSAEVATEIASASVSVSTDSHSEQNLTSSSGIGIEHSNLVVKTYGKLKGQKSAPISSPSLTAPPTESLDKKPEPVKVGNLGKVAVKTSKRVTVPITRNGKRKLIFDPQKQISNSEFKKQLRSTEDIIQAPESGPATKLAKRLMESGAVPQFFTLPGRLIRNLSLARLFSNQLVMALEPENNARDVPISADLGFPSDSNKTANEDISESEEKRLINIGAAVGKPGNNSVESYFRGLNKPTVFKEFTKLKLPVIIGERQDKWQRLKRRRGVQKFEKSSDSDVPALEVLTESSTSAHVLLNELAEEQICLQKNGKTSPVLPVENTDTIKQEDCESGNAIIKVEGEEDAIIIDAADPLS